jgi:hypothetical protein
LSFIRRYGSKRGVELPRDEVPDSLRVGLVNLLDGYRYRPNFVSLGDAYDKICHALRRRPSRVEDAFAEIEWIAGNCSWDEFYQMCETVIEAIPAEVLVTGDPGAGFQALRPSGFVPNTTRQEFTDGLNELFAEEAVPWRIAENHVVPAFPEEVDQILDDATAAAGQLDRPGAATHLRKARQHLSPSSGDLENAVKEAVSAVEAAVKDKAGVDDIDAGLRLLRQQRRLKRQWSAPIQTLFQYASREDQIRHGSPEVSDLTPEEARDLVGLAAILTQHVAGLPCPLLPSK